MQDIRIAAVICPAPIGAVDQNLAGTIRWVRRARKAGAQLVCFPELNITGYCNQPEMAAVAQPIPGRVTDQLAQLALKEGIIILAGMAERNPDGLPFASHCVFTPEGGMGLYRKLHIAPPEKATFAPGNSIPIFKSPGLTFGIQLCYDAHFPELSAVMAAKGIEVLLIPHASPRGNAHTKHLSWLRHLAARAFDNGIFVVACNQTGTNCKGLHFPGNAMVIGPSGEILAKRAKSRPALLLADLNAATLEAVRTHPMRYFFPHRRPELYR
jgi:predicted amidohydrolase